MLRVIVLALVLLNGVYWAWAQGWLLPYGLGPVSQREPWRMAQQIHPRAIGVRLWQEDARLPPPVPLLCKQAGPIDLARVQALRLALEALPPSAWSIDHPTWPPRWIVYMGPYANVVELYKKRTQLAGLRLNFQPLSNPALSQGLSLGAYDTQAAASAALAAFADRGVRTARVMPDQATGYRLRWTGDDDAWQQQMATVHAAIAGLDLTPCPAD